MLNLNWNQYKAQLANPSGKFHSSYAYTEAATLEQLNYEYSDYSRYTAVACTKLINRRLIQFRFVVKDRATEYTYSRLDKNGDIVYGADGLAEDFTVDEMIDILGDRRYKHWFAAFDLRTGKAVGRTQDEWSCLLTLVAPEYAGQGIGAELTRLQLEKHPDMDSGGFTPQGHATRHRMYSDTVRRQFAAGYYRKLYQSGEMTMADIRAIREGLRSAKPRFKLTGKIAINPLDPSMLGIHSELGAIYMYNQAIYTDKEIAASIDWQDLNANDLMLGYAYVLESEYVRRLLSTFGRDIKTERNAALLAIASFNGDTVHIDSDTVARLALDNCQGIARTDEPLDSMRRIPFKAEISIDDFLNAHNRKHELLVKKFDPFLETSYLMMEKLVSFSED